jgi:hypothetical protein
MLQERGRPPVSPLVLQDEQAGGGLYSRRRGTPFRQAWKEGRTGYPWIDAIMVQLRQASCPCCIAAAAPFSCSSSYWCCCPCGSTLHETVGRELGLSPASVPGSVCRARACVRRTTTCQACQTRCTSSMCPPCVPRTCQRVTCQAHGQSRALLLCHLGIACASRVLCILMLDTWLIAQNHPSSTLPAPSSLTLILPNLTHSSLPPLLPLCFTHFLTLILSSHTSSSQATISNSQPCCFNKPKSCSGYQQVAHVIAQFLNSHRLMGKFQVN